VEKFSELVNSKYLIANKMKKNIEEKKYQIELEVVEVGKIYNSAKMIRQTRKNIKKLIFNKLNGRTGEC